MRGSAWFCGGCVGGISKAKVIMNWKGRKTRERSIKEAEFFNVEISLCLLVISSDALKVCVSEASSGSKND